MADEDKTYCGSGKRDMSETDYRHLVHFIMQKFSVSRQDVENAIELAGADKERLEEHFHNRSTPY